MSRLLSRRLEAGTVFEIKVQEIPPAAISLGPVDERTVGKLTESVRSNELLQPVT